MALYMAPVRIHIRVEALVHKHTESRFCRFASRDDLNPIPTFRPLFPAFVTTRSAAFLGGSPPSNTARQGGILASAHYRRTKNENARMLPWTRAE
jgi:hypothetical protein